ncbi:uncharacterized protein MYCFIDRAFT_212014 [Pseudocercospora fijiensis CIRAD86]|uniref:Uncharacterized protein n=1 Tax=Pseudocercospora fijiensis (strain CIRAD86) TaxID=383855 RepID=M3AT24_PSEFD|nr:uncharacterized protein MYCFIDRAFT_212014 [Pseudocercospora fijiensis CIRAD86]EME80263.1 hypothetical protein MYCFIDRAFT_212014 [Pseudocercospora fijiensis CIRAD86]
MSNGKPKVEIPAWQRAGAQPEPAPADDPVHSQPQHEENNDSTPAEAKDDVPDEVAPSVAATDHARTEASQPEEQAEKQQDVTQAEDFESFKSRQQQQPVQQSAPPPQRQQERPPPIITYPEFLVEAQKPPPLVTPGRVLNALYAGGAVAAVLYGASRWLITPMVDALSESRHDLFSHTQTKMDEFNERLAKIASKVPEFKADQAEFDDDNASDTSDPTELYHRDMGTQTSPPQTPSPATGAEVKRDMVTHAEDTLKIIREHISELADGSDKAGEAHKDRQESVNTLRHYLDGLIYGAAGVGTWTQSEDAMTMKKNGTDADGKDGIEELKKEIRGVKGVLLSAKRFPAVSRPIGATA